MTILKKTITLATTFLFCTTTYAASKKSIEWEKTRIVWDNEKGGIVDKKISLGKITLNRTYNQEKVPYLDTAKLATKDNVLASRHHEHGTFPDLKKWYANRYDFSFPGSKKLKQGESIEESDKLWVRDYTHILLTVKGVAGVEKEWREMSIGVALSDSQESFFREYLYRYCPKQKMPKKFIDIIIPIEDLLITNAVTRLSYDKNFYKGLNFARIIPNDHNRKRQTGLWVKKISFAKMKKKAPTKKVTFNAHFIVQKNAKRKIVGLQLEYYNTKFNSTAKKFLSKFYKKAYLTGVFKVNGDLKIVKEKNEKGEKEEKEYFYLKTFEELTKETCRHRHPSVK